MQEYVARDQKPWSWDNVKLPLPSGGWVPHPENMVNENNISDNIIRTTGSLTAYLFKMVVFNKFNANQHRIFLFVHCFFFSFYPQNYLCCANWSFLFSALVLLIYFSNKCLFLEDLTIILINILLY